MSITITPISDDMGVEITGITGAEAATPDIAGQIQDALDTYGVVVLPELNISDDDLAALARLLGDVVLPPHGALADHPEISPITRDPALDKLAKYREANVNWHTDGTMSDLPDKLHVAHRPPDGRKRRGQHRVRQHLRRVPSTARRRQGNRSTVCASGIRSRAHNARSSPTRPTSSWSSGRWCQRVSIRSSGSARTAAVRS